MLDKKQFERSTPILARILDAHMGAVGSGATAYALTKVIGTSTCDMLVAPMEEMGDKLISGICGQVNGSIIPGMLGLEAGQSAFGDIYAWFKRVLMWPVNNVLANSSAADSDTIAALCKELDKKVIPMVEDAAMAIEPTENDIVAVDWMNGRRTPNANQLLKGAISGLNLGSDAPLIFKALVEATAFGAKSITDCFVDQGVRIDEVIAIGGISKKSTFVMQVLADTLNRPIKVASSEQACALGAAMFGATAAGLYATTEEAVAAMNGGFDCEYQPNADRVEIYNKLYAKYLALGGFIEESVSK